MPGYPGDAVCELGVVALHRRLDDGLLGVVEVVSDDVGDAAVRPQEP